MITVSELIDWNRCKRRWAHQDRDGLDLPVNSRRELGRKGHAVAASYLNGEPLDEDASVSYVWTGDDAVYYPGRIIAAGIEHLPEPGSVETEKGFTLHLEDLEISGVMDAFGVTDSGVPVVVDHKLIRKITSRAGPGALRKNYQVIIYAAAAMELTGDDIAIMRWIYYQTVTPYVAKAIELDLTKEELVHPLARIATQAREVTTERSRSPRAIVSLGSRGKQCGAPKCEWIQACRNLDEQGAEIDLTGESLSGLLGEFDIGDGANASIADMLDGFGAEPTEERKKLGEGRKKAWKPPPSTQRWIDLYRSHTKALASSAELAREHLADLRRGEVLSVYSHGSWSTEHVLSVIAEQIGPCDFAMMTWAINDDAVLRFAEAIKAGFIREARALVDERMKIHRPAALDVLQTAIGRGNLAVAPCHAKVYVLASVDPDGMAFSMVSSANFTQNPRPEASTIIEDRELAIWWTARIDEAITNGREYHHTGRLRKEWSDGDGSKGEATQGAGRARRGHDDGAAPLDGDRGDGTHGQPGERPCCGTGARAPRRYRGGPRKR